MWRNHEATSLATPDAFEDDPGLVWLFYSYRRHKALEAKPNMAHYALAELSRKMPGFVTLTQNVDGMKALLMMDCNSNTDISRSLPASISPSSST